MQQAIINKKAPKPNGLKTAFDTVIAPGQAFAALALTPTWSIAFLVTLLFAALGTYVMIPAFQHAFSLEWTSMVAADPRLSQMSQDELGQRLAFTLKFMRFSWIFVFVSMPLLMLVQAVVMTVLNGFGRGRGSFGQWWAVAVNVSLVGAGLNALVTAVIVLVVGANEYSSMAQLRAVMPSLALAVPGASPQIGAFLAAITPFSLWSAGLTVAAMRAIGRVPSGYAWTAGALALLIPAVFGAAFVR